MANRSKKWIGVFCASMDGAKAEYLATARKLGRKIAERGYGVVYGGSTIGAMGALADGALKAGGEVVGVIPDVLMELEISHKGLTELHVVRTWAKLRIHAKPCVLVNLSGFYDPLLEFLDRCVSEGFLKQRHRELVLVARDVDEALAIVEREWGVRDEIPPHDTRLDELVK